MSFIPVNFELLKPCNLVIIALFAFVAIYVANRALSRAGFPALRVENN